MTASILNHAQASDFTAAVALCRTRSWGDYSECSWLRRHVIAPAIHAKAFAEAHALLELIIAHHPNSLKDLTTLSSVLARLGKRGEACQYLERIIAIDGKNYDAVAQLLQQRYLDNQLTAATELALQYTPAFTQHARLLRVGLMILLKAKQFEQGLQTIHSIDFALYPVEIGVLGAQLAFEGQEYALADRIIAVLQADENTDARLYLLSAKILLAKNSIDNRAVPYLLQAHREDGESIQVNSILGELLLNTGKATEAKTYLEKFRALAPVSSHARLLLSRVYKELGQFAEAADEMLQLSALFPDSMKWKRFATSALAQAGKHEEAQALFAAGIRLRDKLLPEHFDSALAQLDAKISHTTLPPQRFQWLSYIADPHDTWSFAQRAQYKNEAIWIHLLDHLIIDWLECRPHQADEIMVYFEDLAAVDSVLRDHLAQGRGLILAGAHLGPLFAIPLALEMLALPHKWLASTPSISSLGYKKTLISTSEQTPTEVIRQVMHTLHAHNIAALAVDGAMSPSAPRASFANQQVTYSDFAAKMAYRTQAPSFFISAFWKNTTIGLQLHALPLPVPAESGEAFCARWQEAYFDAIKTFLTAYPSNARLSGGLWRHIT